MESFVINIVTFGATLMLLYIFLILPVKKRERTKYLVLILVTLLLHLANEFFYLQNNLSPSQYSVFSVAAVLILGPTLYYFVREISGLSTSKFYWHLMPYQIGALIIWIVLFNKLWMVPQWFLSGYYGIILFVYFMCTILIIVKNPSRKQSKWQRTIALGFVLLVMLHLTEIIWVNFFDSTKLVAIHFFNTGLNIYTFVLLILISRQIITNPLLFTKAHLRVPYRYKTFPVNEANLLLIQDYIIKNKAYRDAELDRNMISESTGLNRNEVSQIINKTFKKNLNVWINDLRIEEAKFHLENSDLNVKEIYYEIGYNSKSVFNSAFKKRTGMTPTVYRDQHG